VKGEKETKAARGGQEGQGQGWNQKGQKEEEEGWTKVDMSPTG